MYLFRSNHKGILINYFQHNVEFAKNYASHVNFKFWDPPYGWTPDTQSKKFVVTRGKAIFLGKVPYAQLCSSKIKCVWAKFWKGGGGFNSPADRIGLTVMVIRIELRISNKLLRQPVFGLWYHNCALSSVIVCIHLLEGISLNCSCFVPTCTSSINLTILGLL